MIFSASKIRIIEFFAYLFRIMKNIENTSFSVVYIYADIYTLNIVEVFSGNTACHIFLPSVSFCFRLRPPIRNFKFGEHLRVCKFERLDRRRSAGVIIKTGRKNVKSCIREKIFHYFQGVVSVECKLNPNILKIIIATKNYIDF